jgi:ribonuclease P protein component
MRYFFSKDQRLLRSDHFTRTLRQGVCAADATLVLYATAAADPRVSRIGVTIPNKVGGAVQRNRWRRLIREAYRTQQDCIPAGCDYVIRPKKGAEPNWQAIEASLPKLARIAAKRVTVKRTDN